jgi:hypothetical protein
VEFDNDRDRFVYGYDAGTIVEGTVSLIDGKSVLIDDEGVAFDPQAVLAGLNGKKVRVVIVSFEAVEAIKLLLESQHRD